MENDIFESSVETRMALKALVLSERNQMQVKQGMASLIQETKVQII